MKIGNIIITLTLAALLIPSQEAAAKDIFDAIAGNPQVESTYISGRINNKSEWHAQGGEATIKLGGFDHMYTYLITDENVAKQAKKLLDDYVEQNPDVNMVLQKTSDMGKRRYEYYYKYGPGDRVYQAICWYATAPNNVEIAVVNWKNGYGYNSSVTYSYTNLDGVEVTRLNPEDGDVVEQVLEQQEAEFDRQKEQFEQQKARFEKESAERDARIAKETAERDARIAKETAQRDARIAKETAQREARIARETAQREARIARETAQRESRLAQEKARVQAAQEREKARIEREKAARQREIARMEREKASRERQKTSGSRNWETAKHVMNLKNGIKRLESYGTFDIHFKQGAPSIAVSGDYNDVRQILVSQDDDVLMLKENPNQGVNTRNCTVIVTSPDISSFVMYSTGDLTISPWKGDSFSFQNFGTCDMAAVSITSGNTVLRDYGSGDIGVAAVNGNSLEVYLAGSGDISIGAIKVKNSDLMLLGSGDMTCKFDDQTADIYATNSASGDMTLSGRCRTATTINTGSGDLIVSQLRGNKIINRDTNQD